MSRTDWGCDDSQLQYIHMGITAWLQTHAESEHHDSIERIEVYPICKDNQKAFSRLYEIDGKMVVHLYAYNIIKAATKFGVYTKLLTMFLIEHEVAHLFYQSHLAERKDSWQYRHPSEEKYCDTFAVDYMRTIYSHLAIDGIFNMMAERNRIYAEQRNKYLDERASAALSAV